jgi:hypothetical protein
MTHGFKNGRLFAEQGTNERTGAGEIWKYDNGSDNVQTFMSDGSPEGVHAADKGSFAHDYTNGTVYVKTTDTVATGWELLSTAESTERLKQNYVENIGIDYDGGTGVFTVQGADATLSSTNIGYVTLQSKANPGELVSYSITADQSFIDDNGSSEIIGNLFGVTTGVAWANDCPFYLYAVGNDNEDTVAFMISRIPHRTVAPATANIGAPDDAVADTQGSFFSLENIDETLYDGNPCLCLGAFRMQMSASDDWTVQTLDNTDGIGLFHDSTLFTFPLAQNGAATGTYVKANGGTAPIFSDNDYRYMLMRSGNCNTHVYLNGDGGTDGSGAVVTFVAAPLAVEDSSFSNAFPVGSGALNSVGSGNVGIELTMRETTAPTSVECTIFTTGNSVLHSAFTNGARYLWYNSEYQASIT